MVTGLCHPSLYNFLVEIIKGQGETKVTVNQLNLGQKVKKIGPLSRQKVEDNVQYCR